jgi:hypothetical protein
MMRLAALTLATLAAVPAAAAPMIRAVETGLGGYVRPPGPMAVVVEIDNPGGAFEGELQIERPESVATTTPVALPGGARKRLTLYLPLSTRFGFGSTRIVVRLRSGRDVVAEQTAAAQLVTDGELVLASATTEGGGLSFLNDKASGNLGWPGRVPRGARGIGGRISAAHFAPETMPRHAPEWSTSDLLALTGEAWRRLEPEQRRAVRMWVQSGGRLLACGEAAAAWNDPEGQALLPVEGAGSVALADVAALRALGGKTLRLGEGRIVIAGVTPRTGADVAVRQGAHPLLVSWPSGFGSVTWLGLDPFRGSFRRWAGFPDFWQALLTRILSEPIAGAVPRELEATTEAANGMAMLPRLPAPSRPALAAIALAYAVIFGPVNIWMLRRLRRTVRAWLFLPALSLAMTGVLLAAGYAWGRGYAVLNRVTIVEAMTGSRTGREQELIGIFSPANRTFDFVSSDRTLRLVRLAADEGTGAAANPEMVPTQQTETGVQWREVPFALWSLQQFKVERTVDLGGTVTVRLGADLSGEAHNATPYRLEECQIERGSLRYDLGTLVPGARAALVAAGWQRRSRAEENANPGTYRPPENVSEDRFPAIREGVALMFAINTGGGEEEAVLTARVAELKPSVQVPGLAVQHNRASLIVVRVPVKGDAAGGLGAGSAPGAFPRLPAPVGPLSPGRAMAPPSVGM